MVTSFRWGGDNTCRYSCRASPTTKYTSTSTKTTALRTSIHSLLNAGRISGINKGNSSRSAEDDKLFTADAITFKASSCTCELGPFVVPVASAGSGRTLRSLINLVTSRTNLVESSAAMADRICSQCKLMATGAKEAALHKRLTCHRDDERKKGCI